MDQNIPSKPEVKLRGVTVQVARTALRYQRIPVELPDTHGHTPCRSLTLFLEKITISSVAGALNILGQGN